eukprot:c20639_g1_i3 orf=1098-1451(+)
MSTQNLYLQSFHDDLFGDHLPFLKVLEKLCSKIFWPKLRWSVHNFLRSCPICQLYKSPTKKLAGDLQSIIASEPFELIAYDIAGSFPCSESGNSYIVVLTDYVTHWAIAQSLPSAFA